MWVNKVKDITAQGLKWVGLGTVANTVVGAKDESIKMFSIGFVALLVVILIKK
jgi:hypothetical protein